MARWSLRWDNPPDPRRPRWLTVLRLVVALVAGLALIVLVLGGVLPR